MSRAPSEKGVRPCGARRAAGLRVSSHNPDAEARKDSRQAVPVRCACLALPSGKGWQGLDSLHRATKGPPLPSSSLPSLPLTGVPDSGSGAHPGDNGGGGAGADVGTMAPHPPCPARFRPFSARVAGRWSGARNVEGARARATEGSPSRVPALPWDVPGIPPRVYGYTPTQLCPSAARLEVWHWWPGKGGGCF